MIRNATRVFAALAALTTGFGAASAAPFQDQLVQPPSIGDPQRGSIAGSLSKLSFGAADLARGAYSLPLPIEVPKERGPLLAQLFPSYSAEGEQSEWGMGWGSDLAIRRHRVLGDLQYDETDEFTSPWGRLLEGDDGSYYPAGLRSVARARPVGDGWQVTTQDGTVYTFLPTDTVVNSRGTYAWMLSRVDALLGDSTVLTWTANDSGRRFLQSVSWGGRHDGTQYQASFVYETLAKPFVSYASSAKLTLDRRVLQIVVKAKVGQSLRERWRYDLGYQKSPLGPAFYLAQVRRTFASGASEPALSYDYDMGVEQLATAALTPQPALDLFLTSAGASALQPDHASMTDLEQNGLTDLEHYYSYTMVKQTEDGFVFESLPAKNGAENPLCRPDPSVLNKPRLLARMLGDLGAPQVVVVRKNGVGTTTTITMCDRAGMTQAQPTVGGNWELSANTRLADVDLDHRPDIVRVYNGGVQVLRNFSSATQWSFLPMPGQILSPAISASASWVLDFNGDGKPDLMARTTSGVVVWLGVGYGRFETTGRPFQFRTVAGVPLANVNEYQFSHGDFNGDGLSDIILSKAQSAFVYLNQGDEFQQRSVPGLASIPFTFGYPIVGDLTASGNPEVVFVDGSHAKTIQLSSPATGLLRKADDGKGSLVRFGYRRARPEPGLQYRYALLDSLTLESSGYDPVTYHYDYAQAVWHSLGHFLVGFARTSKTSPLLVENVQFHNDDDVAGVVTGTSARDPRTPGLEKFSATVLEAADFHGVPWRRQQSVDTGVRSYDGSNQLVRRVDFEAYARGICPVRVATSLGGDVLTREETLASIPGLDDLHCQPASQRLRGQHQDASRDFDYTVSIARNELGQVTQLTQNGPQGQLVLQQNGYDASARLRSSGAPGRGTMVTSYDGHGELEQVMGADGQSTRILGRDPLSDAIWDIQHDRGGGAQSRMFYAYDGLERLQSSWNDYSGASAAQPSRRLSYQFASNRTPAATTSDVLIDAGNGARRQSVDVLGADEGALTSALIVGEQAIFGGLTVENRSLGQRSSRRLAPRAAASLTSLLSEELRSSGIELGAQTQAGFGYDTSALDVVQDGVTSRTTSTLTIEGGELIMRTRQNDSYVRESGQDAGGRITWVKDEAGVVHRYAYDALGRLIEVQTPDGRHRIRFDSYGHQVRVEREGLVSIDYQFSPVTGLPTRRRIMTPAGTLVSESTSSYDDVGRKTRVLHHDAASGAEETFEYGYDGDQGAGRPALLGQLGQLSRVTGPGFERRMSYDRAGRPLATVLRLGAWRELQLSTTSRADGSPATITTTVRSGAGAVLDQHVRDSQVDAVGRPVRLLVDGHELYHLFYDGEGRLARAELASGEILVFEFDPLTGERRGYHIDGPVWSGGISWQFDARGHIRSETLTSQSGADTRDYAYDARGFLAAALGGGEDALYGYTASGLPATIRDRVGQRNVQRSGAQLDAGGVSYQYDGIGRVVRKGGLTLAYGPAGHLAVARHDGHEVRYVHDENGQRLLKLVDGVAQIGFLSGNFLTEDALIEPVEIGGVFIGVLENGEFTALLTDARGTPLLDAAGQKYWGSPYGMRTHHAAFAAVLDYARQGYDADLGTVRMGVRDYDPYLSQFWTPDPLFLEDLGRCQKSPVECGLYGYAGNDPLSYTDPTGHEKTPADSCKADSKPKHHKPKHHKPKPKPKAEDPDEGIEIHHSGPDHALQEGDYLRGNSSPSDVYNTIMTRWNTNVEFDVPKLTMADYDQFRAWYSVVNSTRAVGFVNDIRLTNSGVVISLEATQVWRMKQVGVSVTGSGGASATGTSETGSHDTRSISVESKLSLEAGIPGGKLGGEVGLTGTHEWGTSKSKGVGSTDGGTGSSTVQETVWEEDIELTAHMKYYDEPNKAFEGSYIGDHAGLGNFTLYTFYK